MLGNRVGVISTVNRLRAGPSGARIPAGARYFSFLKIVQPGSGVHPVSYLNGHRGSYWGGQSGRSVMLTTNLYLVPCLNMGRGVPLLSLFTFTFTKTV